jgi:hypothetical protein
VISETTFAKRFTSFWNELLPNAKNYTRLINAGQFTATHRPFATPTRKQNVALVNVFAFNLYRLLATKRTGFGLVSNRLDQHPEYSECFHSAMSYLSRFGNYQLYQLPLSDEECSQAKELTKILLDKYDWKRNPLIDPRFDGCGCINPATGDIYLPRTLVEIKSGERSFSVTDFRQLIVYCALNHYSRSPLTIDRIEIFNPRMGALFSEDVNQLSLDLSALAPLELFSEIQRFIADMNFVETSDT